MSACLILYGPTAFAFNMAISLGTPLTRPPIHNIQQHLQETAAAAAAAVENYLKSPLTRQKAD